MSMPYSTTLGESRESLLEQINDLQSQIRTKDAKNHELQATCTYLNELYKNQVSVKRARKHALYCDQIQKTVKS